MADVDVRRARPGDLESARRLLLASGLPVEDLREASMENFFVATSGASIIGFVGLEAFAGVGLLRSLVVEPGARSAGVGRLLVETVESHARQYGISELWLLTIDANRYFRSLGYTVKKRDEVPPAIRATAEFSELCPCSATLMQKIV